MVQLHLLLPSFLNKVALDLHRDANNATKTTFEGAVVVVTPMGKSTATSYANLAQAFTSQCHVTQDHPDWYVDSGATAHMTSSPDNFSNSAPHSGNMRVFFGETVQVIAQGLCEDGLYVLRDTPMALAATVGVSRQASFELWHNRLGHVSFDGYSTE
ncbi:zinc finger, CCHC-type [Artemisia annua]|uniref:Zinc finger, CCHC-type n=1 Tax=Artemisia annua TaxID=35608 RepID=A0A2U1MBG5_ARTAN|nr:zinc finger, CCHC-type [Artemisia annua]